MDIDNDMNIDPAALDVEWMEQPKLAVKYGRYWAKCAQRLAEAEEDIKVVRSELIEKANGDPETFLGVGVKPTGPNIESFYRNHRSHKAAKKELFAAQHALNEAEVFKSEISFSRKNALENLVKLHAQSYFAGPSEPRDLVGEVNRRQERMNSKMARRKRTK